MSNEHLFATEALPQLDALYNFAFKLCRDKHHTNDLVQETLLNACRAFHTYQPGTNCRAWLFQICKNAYINEYRRSQYKPLAVDFSDASMYGDEESNVHRHACIDPKDVHEVELHTTLVGDEVADALNSLPLDYQTVLILSDVEGQSYEEIAEFAHAPIGTIRSRIHRARRMLAERLQKFALRNGYGQSLFAPTANNARKVRMSA